MRKPNNGLRGSDDIIEAVKSYFMYADATMPVNILRRGCISVEFGDSLSIQFVFEGNRTMAE